MARARRRPNSALIDHLFEFPDAYELFQAIRIVERMEAGEAKRRGTPLPEPVGRGVDPKRAAAVIRSSLSLRFASAEVNGLRRSGAGPVEITQSVFGLTGPSGVMPLAVSEMVQASVRERNPGLRAFFGLFTDRLAALFYDAWTKHRIVIETERREITQSRGIDTLLRALVGVGFPQLGERMTVPDGGLIHHGGLLSRQSRSAHAVEQVLSNSLALPIRIEQFVGEWVPIAAAEQTRMPSPTEPSGNLCRLGEEAVVGERAFMVQGAVRILIGPLSYEKFSRLLPGEGLQKQLCDLALFTLGPGITFKLRLTLKAAEVPSLSLGDDELAPGASRLGWNTWLGSTGARRVPGEVDLEPASPLHLN